ncbi:PTS sugar transporter subunit IIA [Cellulomonas cellasea]|uniref:Phosphocarrier protein HPr n=1 Tax=Cellulomonas cellasea TaxID=43670 RepID=A0A4Y3KX15_9CELL|nr:dihydroxyacetone kinase phosphoryl donor subunit DhaM [Cellulomonas cellasea]GEA88387.1 PTS sugar transporter subunit IIA [Cellulomonas cellasea]
MSVPGADEPGPGTPGSDPAATGPATIDPAASDPAGAVRVGLVLVSHSALLAQGAVELARQMAPDVALHAAGGDGHGGLGTSYDDVERAVAAATDGGRAAVVLVDLGSALLTTESVLELADEDVAARVRVADAPFVEGAVAAAVRAQTGGSADEVLAAAESAPVGRGRVGETAPVLPRGAHEPRAHLTAEVTLRNALGLHARPAAVLARLVGGFEAVVTVDGVNAASVLELMKLGVTGGQSVTVTASGPQARAALDALVAAVEGAFGEA